MAAHTRTGTARFISRTAWWRAELAAAETPAAQFAVAQRWLHALVRQAEQTGRRRGTDAEAFSDTAEDALAEAAQAVAAVCQKLERADAGWMGRVLSGRLRDSGAADVIQARRASVHRAKG